MRTLENTLRRVGFVYVAGVDEVGRGCLAGPVVAAAVVLHPDKHIPGVCDSKLVPAPERERIFPLHLPTISKVEVVRSAKVRRAKLYYLRDLKGKAARMKDAVKA